jgi:hypothetical protein
MATDARSPPQRCVTQPHHTCEGTFRDVEHTSHTEQDESSQRLTEDEEAGGCQSRHKAEDHEQNT